MLTTIGRLHFDDVVPEQYRKDLPPEKMIDSKSIKNILQNVADSDPEQYRKISHELLKLGDRGAVETETSFGLNDLADPLDRSRDFAEIDKKEREIVGNRALTDTQRTHELTKLYLDLSTTTPKRVYEASLANGNNLAKMVASGARGSVGQLNSNIGSDWLILDNEDKPIGVPIRSSYAQGFTPAEYFAQSYGTRSGLVKTKLATRDSGFASKKLAAASQDLVVTAHDCGTTRGISVPVDDRDNTGAVLATAAGNHPAGTIITRHILNSLKGAGIKNITVRSPMTCEAEHGLCSTCSGIRERGVLPPLMDNIGLGAASAAGEPLCLAEGTLVQMADGSHKTIESIVPGDMVLGSDLLGNTAPTKVIAVHNNGNRECFEFKYGCHKSNIVTVNCTKEHRILARINRHQPWSALPMPEAHFAFTKKAFLRLQSYIGLGELPTYDLEVECEDHLYVLANQLITHNSQSAISSKHGGGVAGSVRKATGFQQINALLEVPEKYPDGTPVSKTYGMVSKVEKAPQGGHFVYIGDDRYHVPMEQNLIVKPGSKVDAGDPLGDGVVSPADVVKHKGIGQGRVYLMNSLTQAFHDNGMPLHRRNAEVLARGIINHVRITGNEGVGGHLPDDVVEYNNFEKHYEAPENTKALHPQAAIGQFLQKPALHFSIGTKVTPNVSKVLHEAGTKEVHVSPDKPEFEPEMTRLIENPGSGHDWAKHLTVSYVKRNLLDDVISGIGSSDIHGTDPMLPLGYGMEFGRPSREKPKQVGY